MCLIALAYHASDRFPLVIAGNRDEFLDRPTAPLALWHSAKGTPILGGRDLKEGGSWMGFTASGRFAIVTNVRDPEAPAIVQPISRGGLVSAWLDSQQDSQSWLAGIEVARYNGFNLIVGDWVSGEMAYFSNKALTSSQSGDAVKNSMPAPRMALMPLAPRQVYGLSNASLDTPWPKTVRLKSRIACAAQLDDQDELVGQLLNALGDTAPAADEQLPRTGVPIELERALSSACVSYPADQPNYGTRSSWVAVLNQAGHMHLTERSYPDQGQTASVRFAKLAWPMPAPA